VSAGRAGWHVADVARRPALDDQFPTPQDNDSRPADWELEAAQVSIEEAARRVLLDERGE
jgi:hypothetical protein